MPPKKKVAKTEEIPTETDETLKQEPSNEEVENIQKPKKPKRVMTEKQKENFAKLQEANKLRYEAKRKAKEQETNNKIQEVEVKQEEKKEIKNYNKSFGLKNDKPPAKQEVAEEVEEEEEVIIKKKPVKKKKKQKIIIEEDSSSDSENEIIIRRSRGRKKSKPIDIPQEQPTPEPIDITPIEETKKEEPIELTKKYTAQQILKGLGL